MEISILQWNVLYKEKADNVISLIKDISADVVCLQELTQDSDENPGINIPDLIASLGYHQRYFITLTERNFVMGNAVFSKYPITKKKSYYARRGKKLASYDNAYEDEPRSYIEAQISMDNQLLTIGTTHLSYCDGFVSTLSRDDEDKKFIELVSKHDKKFIFSGDFNMVPKSNLIRSLSKKFQSAGPDFSKNTWTTKPFSYNGFEANTLDWRLDYVFATPDIKVISSKIIDTKFSDHLPILTTIDI